MNIRWIGLCVVMGLVAESASMARADEGRPSRAALEAMGLGSLVVMSDDDASAVRGQGYMGGSYVRVTGSSFATIEGPDGGSHSENSYFAEGKHKAKGHNSSYAGVADIWFGGKGGHKGGDKPRSGGNYGGWKPGSNGYPGSGYPGGGGYGHVKIHARAYFSGGSSSAWAF